MKTLENQNQVAFNTWLSLLKTHRIQPDPINTEIMITVCGLAHNTADIQKMANDWLTQAVNLNVLIVNPNPHPYLVNSSH